MSQDGEQSYYRPMTAEEINAENEKFQRKLTEKMHKELPGKMNALWDLVEESFDDEHENTNGAHAPTPSGLTNGHGSSPKTNGLPNGSSSFFEERELLLKVRERENQELTKTLDEVRRQYQRDVNELKNEVSRITVEKQRTFLSLEDTQEALKTHKSRLETLQKEYDKMSESERRLKSEVELYKLTVDDKDKMIKILENGSEDNRKFAHLEKQLQAKDEQHRAEIKNFNDQLELSFRKCKTYEREVFDLERKVKALQAKNDEILIEKTETITRLMGQINELQNSLERSSYSPADYQEKFENEATIRSLRAQLAERESNIQLQQTEITDLRRLLEDRPTSVISPERRRESISLRERVLDLELKLAEKEAQLAKPSVKKSLRPAAVQTEPWSVDDNNIQYLRFHEERMSNLRDELEEQRSADLAEKETVIEGLKEEIEQVKRMYLDLETERDSIDVRKLQEELSTAKDRLLELKRTHSEFCQPDLEKRIKEVTILKERVQELEAELSDRETQQKAYQETKEADNRHIVELKRLVSLENEQKLQLKEEIGKFERQILTLTDDVSKLEEQMSRMERAHREELDSLRGIQTPGTSVATPPRSREDRSVGTSPRVKENQSVSTSPLGKVLTEPEIMRLLQNLAHKHEEERVHYVSRIEELQALLVRASARLSGQHQLQRSMTDASTMTDVLATATAEPSSELILELWRKLEDLRNQNEALTVRSRRTEEVEADLSRVNEQCSRLQEKLSKLKADLTASNEKYLKLKEHSKSYKEYFRKVILDINEERQKDLRKWKDERATWERESAKREQALLELRSQVANLHNPAHVDGVVNVARLYDELIASLRTDRS